VYMYVHAYMYVSVYVCIYIYIRARVGVHMHSCRRILFICTVQSLSYMRMYHRCFLTLACVCVRGLEVGFNSACSCLALVTGVGGYVLAGVEIWVLSCIFLGVLSCTPSLTLFKNNLSSSVHFSAILRERKASFFF